MFIQNSTHQHTVCKDTNIHAVANGIWWCDQLLAEIAAFRAHHRHILCKAVAIAVADEFARDARVYAEVDHCAADTKSCVTPSFLLLSTWIVAITTVQQLCPDASPSLFLYSARRYSVEGLRLSKLEWVDIIVVDNWPFWNM